MLRALFALARVEPTLGTMEGDYRRQFLRADIQRVQAGVWISLGLSVLALSAELSLWGGEQVVSLIILRATFAVLSVGMLWVLRSVRTSSTLDYVSVGWALVFVAEFLALVAWRPASAIDEVGVVVAVLALYMILPTTLPWRVLPAVLISVGFVLVIGLVRRSHSGVWLAGISGGLVMFHVIGAWASSQLQTQRRRQFQAQEKLRASLNERDALQEQLFQAQKMEALGRLAAGLAHDFNQLLSIIGMHASLAQRDVPGDSRAHAQLGEIGEAVNRGASLARQLLGFRGPTSLKPDWTALDGAIHDIERMLRLTLPADVQVELRLDARGAEVLIDRGQFDQIMVNLITNAGDAMPSGGKILVITERVAAGAHDDVNSVAMDGDRLRVEVRDTGIGMDAATAARAWEPFFTTRGSAGGTGLGLSIVYRIATQAGGTVSIKSQTGVGTSVVLLFPLRSGSST